MSKYTHGRNMIDEYVQSLGELEFTSPKISTMALIGHIFSEEYLKSGTASKLDLYEVCESVDMTAIPELSYIEFKSDKRSIAKGKNGKAEELSESKGFANSASFVIEIEKDRKPIKLKLSTNGSLQLPGFKNNEEIGKFLTIFRKVLDGIPAIPKENLDVRITSVSMIKYDLSLTNEKVYLDSSRLANYIIQNTNMFISYEGIESRSAEIQFVNDKGESIDGYPFWSFKINLTSVKSIETVESSYNYITDFLIKNIREFVMLDNLTNLILTLKLRQCAGDQKSEEWLKFRHSTIGASEVASVFGLGYNKSRAKLIEEKVQLRFNGQKTFFGNAATRHGETFEPIAIQFFARYWNKASKKPVKVFTMQVSSLTHNKYPFISASPDALVFTTEKEYPYDKVWTLEELEKEKANIIDFFTLEIKCPSNYKLYDGSMSKMIECTDGYVPSYYWCQMMQQMYVTGANHGIFMNNNFKEYSEEEYDADCANKAQNYRGLILKVYDYEGDYIPIVTLYPKDVLAKKEAAISELMEKAEKYPNLKDLHPGCHYVIVYWKLVGHTLTNVEYSPDWESKYVPEIVKCEEEICSELEKKSDIDLV